MELPPHNLAPKFQPEHEPDAKYVQNDMGGSHNPFLRGNAKTREIARVVDHEFESVHPLLFFNSNRVCFIVGRDNLVETRRAFIEFVSEHYGVEPELDISLAESDNGKFQHWSVSPR